MKGIAIGALTLALVLAGACERSHTRNSSGSNWLRCDTLADCSAADEAVACDGQGFCVDGDGHRIAAVPDMDPPPAPDAGERDAGPVAQAGSDAPAPSNPCPWGVDALLEAAGVSAEGRGNCGNYNLNVAGPQTVSAAMRCFDDAVADGRAVEITINRCLDCSLPTTFVANASGELYSVLMAQDLFSDERERRLVVEACTEIRSIVTMRTDDSISDVLCTEPVELYTCTEPLDVPKEPPPSPPVAPFKTGDVPAAEGESTVPLHLYVSNQSFEHALIDIAVYIDDVQVVTGDFDVGGQHNWFEFEIAVAPGTRSVRAFTRLGDVDLEQAIDVPAERWAVIDYWYYPDEAEGEHFTLSVQDTPVAFQ